MRAFDVFRRDLATSLRACADRRRGTPARDRPQGDDSKIIALLERLAADAENLDLRVFLVFQLMFTHKGFARRFIGQHEDLLAQLGILYCPSSATDLVRWLTRRTIADGRQDHSSSVRPRPRFSAEALVQRLHDQDSVARDISAGVGVAAPMFAVWEVGLGIGQWRDRAMSEGHAGVPAAVLSSEPSAGVRNSGLSSTIVLSFRPAGSADACQLPVQTGHAPPVAGMTVMVVPRSARCEAPILPSEIGDPVATFMLAALLMIGGLSALKSWAWLDRPKTRRLQGTSLTVWSQSNESDAPTLTAQ